MFKAKSSLSVKESRQLSGKDVKTIRKKIEAQFDRLPESVLDALVPPKCEVTLLKLSNRTSAYAVGGQPLFFDLDGRGSGPLLPTVYSLWLAADAAASSSSSASPLLPEVFTFSEVSPKVLGGADLFLQGFLPEKQLPEGLSAGDLAVVRVDGNRYPFAVGSMEVSSADAVAAGMKGKGLKLLHHAFDGLWAMGDRSVPCPRSFTPTRIFPSGGDGDGAAAAGAPAAAAAAEPSGPEKGEEKREEQRRDQSDVERAAEGVAALGLSPSSSSPSAFFPPDLDLSSVEGQDALAEYLLLAACASIEPSSLPMQTSDFQKEMTKRRPPGLSSVALDLKKTSYKQLSKLLKKFEKLGVLSTKAIRKQDHVSSVDRGHALVVEFLDKGGGGGGGGSEGDGAATTSPSPSAPDRAPPPSSSVPPIAIEPAYRVSPSLRPVFAAPGAPPPPSDELYSERSVVSALRSYCDAEKLSSPSDPGSASVDRLLLSALFNKGERELAEGGKALPLADLERRLLSRLTRHTRVRRFTSSDSYEEKVFRGPLKRISISCEDRQGGRKHVTRVAGVERYALSPASLATTLQREFKTSASVSRVREEEEEVALQGDLASKLVSFFEREYGIGAEHVEVRGKGGR